MARLAGIVDPAEAAYVQRVIGLAQAQHAQAVVLNLEVSGGLTLEDLVPKRKPKEAT